MKERQIRLESNSRKKNLTIWGIREEKNESKYDTKRKVKNIFRDYGKNFNPKDLDNLNRVGPKNNHAPRPTKVNFIYSEDKEMAQTVGKELYFDHGMRMKDNFPHEIEAKRKDPKPILHTANHR